MVPMHAPKQKEAFQEPQGRAGVSPASVGKYVFSPKLPLRQERGLSTLRSSTATEDGQAASPSALADRKGIWQGPLDCPTRKRRKRRAPLACATATLNKYVGNADGTERLALARSLGRRDPSSVAVLRRVDACPTFGALWFMVLMHAHKRNEAFHERCSSGVESAHSALEKFEPTHVGCCFINSPLHIADLHTLPQ